MPITIKQNLMRYKNPSSGEYQSVDVIAETTTSEHIAAIQSEASDQMDAIEQKGLETIDSIPSDYTELSDEVADLKSAINAEFDKVGASAFKWAIGKTISNSGVVSTAAATAVTDLFTIDPNTVIYNSSNKTGMNNKDTIFYVHEYVNSVWQKRTLVASEHLITVGNQTNEVRIVFGYAGNAGNTETQEDVNTNFGLKFLVPVATKKYAEKIESDLLTYARHSDENTDIEYITGTIINTGATNTTATGRIRTSNTLYKVNAGDFYYVEAPYKFRVFIYSDNKPITANFVAYLNQDFISGAFFIPEQYVGKYSAICICKEGYEESDISTDVSTITNYVHYYVPASGGTVQNIYNNTYDITTTPIITTDTNGWLQAIDTDTESETDKTDMTGAIMSMLTDTGYCHLGEGIFYVSGNIDMPKGSTLCGCGKSTVIRLLSSVTNGYVVKMKEYCTIRDVCLSGSYNNISTPSSNGGRDAVWFVADYDGTDTGTSSLTEECMMSNVWIINFSGNGVYCHNTSINYAKGLYALNVYIQKCYKGINIDYYSEFNKFTNISISWCYYACVNNGGNNVFTACTFHATNTGFYIDGSQPNAAHGIINGCTFCHIGSNSGIAIQMNGVVAGFVVSNCQIWYDSVILYNCQGVVFDGCEFGRGVGTHCATIDINGGSLILFSACVFHMDATRPIDLTITNNTKTVFSGCYGDESGSAITIT